MNTHLPWWCNTWLPASKTGCFWSYKSIHFFFNKELLSKWWRWGNFASHMENCSRSASQWVPESGQYLEIDKVQPRSKALTLMDVFIRSTITLDLTAPSMSPLLALLFLNTVFPTTTLSHPHGLVWCSLDVKAPSLSILPWCCHLQKF